MACDDAETCPELTPSPPAYLPLAGRVCEVCSAPATFELTHLATGEVRYYCPSCRPMPLWVVKREGD